ncbi:hypothetical protein BDD12DRAFT_808093 [Trichophaea hybrida]|nr:hypothetical protein BDD12DRAFT_808093 [Trichophaea hybrida]
MLPSVIKRFLTTSHASIRIIPRRNYASLKTDLDPYRWPPGKYPTPYDILEVKKDGLYSKHRYMELVKIYHPDHNHHHRYYHLKHPHHVRLERFNLIVTANSILSDTQKRSAYDRYGAGWAAAPSSAYPHPVYHPRRRHNRGTEKWWQAREGRENFYSAYGQGGPDDASNNATWEDWERWYEAQSQGADATVGKQQELHTRNSVFVVIVVMLACLGSFAEINYATVAGNEAIELGERQSIELGRDIMRRRRESMESGSREERIKRFLMMRDPVEAKRYR